MTGYIYSLSDSNTDMVIYIGSTFCPKTRHSAHLSSAKRGKSGIYKHILENNIQIRFDIVEEIDTRKDWELLLAESFWIEQFRQWGFPLLNKIFYKSYTPNIKPEVVIDKATVINIPTDLLDALKAVAIAEDRPLSWTIRNIIRQSPIVTNYKRQKAKH